MRRRGKTRVTLTLLTPFESPHSISCLVGEPLGEIGVVLLHDVEHRVLGEAAVVLGEEFMQVGEFVVIHGNGASAAMPDYSASS
jgi:hypothetical protein